MQRKLLIIICLLSTVFIAFGQKKKRKNNSLVYQSASADTAKINYKVLGAPMPPFKMRLIKGQALGDVIMTSKDLADKNVLVMMYNPTCGHCQEETIVFKKNIELFTNAQIILLSDTAMKPYIDFFENSTKVSEVPAIKIGLDYAGFINNTFIYESLPQLNIYSKERKLIKVFTGDTPIDSLKPYIQ